MKNLARGVFAGACIFAHVAGWAGTNAWTDTGPNVSDVQVRFSSSPDIAYARGGERVWKSTDAGQTWVTMLRDSGAWSPFAVDPQNPNIVIIGFGFFSDGMLRSVDGGATFNFVYSGSTYHVGFSPDGTVAYASGYFLTSYVGRSTDRGATWVGLNGTGLPQTPAGGGVVPIPTSIAVDGVSNDTLYAGFQSPDHEGIYRSINGGNNWAPGSGLHAVHVREIATHPVVSGRAFAATMSGLYRTSDTGLTWSRVADPSGSGVATAMLRSLAIDRVNPQLMYAGSEYRGEIYFSSDGGATWTRRDSGILANRVNTIAPRPGHEGQVLAGTSHTLYRSTNAGQAWAVSAAGIRLPNVSALQNGSKLRVGLEDGGIYESLDGETWTAVNNASLRAALPDNRFSELHEILETENRLFAMPNVGGLVSGPIQGGSWSLPAPGYPGGSLINHLGGLLTLGGTSNVLLAGTNQGIYRSANEGASWQWSATGLPVTTIWSMAQKGDGSAVYAGTFNFGVYKSVDGGFSWLPLNNGLTDLTIKSLAYDDANDVLVVGTNNGLFYTGDGGANYTALPNPWPIAQQSVDAIVVEDFMRGALYIGFQKKVFRSVDRGQNWTELHENNPYTTSVARINALVSDGPGVLYMGGYWSGLEKYTVSPDARLTSSVLTAGAHPIGTRLPWQFTVTNGGPHASTFTQAGFAVPANVTLRDLATSRGSCALSVARRLNCDLGVMPAGDIATVTMSIEGTSGGAITLAPAVTIAEIDRDPANDSVNITGVRFVEQVDLTATLTAAPASVNSGAAIEYTLVVGNAGNNAVTGATFETTFDARDQYTLAQGSAAGCTGNVAGVQTCPLPTILAGGSATYRWTVTPQWGGARAPSVVVRVDSLNSIDANPANNSASAATSVVPVTDLSVTMTAPTVTFLQGAGLTLTATVRNNSTIDAAAATATITLSNRVTLINAAGDSNTTCTRTGNIAGCSLGPVAAGASRTITVELTGSLPGTAGNTVSVTSLGPDPVAANNSVSLDLTVNPANDLAIELSAPATATTGGTTTLTVNVSNRTATDATGTRVDVTLPSGVTYVSATNAVCSASGASVSCDAGVLPGNGSKSMVLTLNAVAAGAANFAATITGSAVDPVTTNNSATASTTLSAPPPASSSSSSGGSGGGGGGGGGAFDLASLMALLALTGLFIGRRRIQARGASGGMRRWQIEPSRCCKAASPNGLPSRTR